MTGRWAIASGVAAAMLGAAVLAAAALRPQNPQALARTPDGAAMTGAKVARCAFCHGPDGRSVFEIWPNLAGQDAAYLAVQLDAFAKGPQGPRRGPHAAQMYAVARALSPEDRRAIATHYARLPAAPLVSADKAGLGRSLHLEGAGKVAACASCHGQAGEGNAQLGAPRIGGQHARYTAGQLRAFASGARGDKNNAMAAIAAAMTDEQITAIAAYLDADRTGVTP